MENNNTTNDKNNDEIKDFSALKTGGTSIETPTDELTSELVNDELEFEKLTLIQKNDIKYKESITKKNNAHTKLLNVFKRCTICLGSLLGLAVAILTIFWAYKISSLAEPMGGIKVQINELIKYRDEEIKPRFKEWDSIYTELKVKEIIYSEKK